MLFKDESSELVSYNVHSVGVVVPSFADNVKRACDNGSWNERLLKAPIEYAIMSFADRHW